jgi:hypothetical protein
MLEPYAGKLARPVLRGGGEGDLTSLPDRQGIAVSISKGLIVSDAPSTANPELLATGRQLLREHPKLTEAEFRNLMVERFREADQGLQQDKRNMTASPGHGSADGILTLFMLPWTFFRWLGWRGRLGWIRSFECCAVKGTSRQRRPNQSDPENQRDSGRAEPAVTLDRAGITVFRDIPFLAAGPASEHRTRPCRDTTGRNRAEKARKAAEGGLNEVGTPASGI